MLKYLSFSILVFLLFCLPFYAIGEGNDVDKRITFISPDVSFFVEADLFINNTINPSPYPLHKSVKVLSNRVRIVVPTTTVAIFDQLYNAGQPIFQPENYEFSVRSKFQNDTDWHPIRSASLIENTGTDIYILDTLLDYDESFSIFFRKRNMQIVRSVEIERINIAPEIIYYRDNKAKNARTGSKSNTGNFKRFSSNAETDQYIVVEPGDQLEVIFKDLNLNIDTAIEYTLNCNNNPHHWSTTGTATLLSQLEPNTIYTLEARFKYSNRVNNYYIRVLPAWYQNSWLIISIVTISLLLLCLAVYGYFRMKIKREQKNKAQVQYKLRAIQSQLNPHFIFNALSSIQSLVNKDKKLEANKYLSEFAGVMRGALKNSDTVLIPLAEELKLLKSYLQIEQLRFNFQFQLNVHQDISISDVEIPPMLIQPSIENAIKHGISSLGAAGLIDINFERKGDDLHICIKDNGGGHKLYEHSKDGYGVKLTKERVAALNEIFKQRHVAFHIEFTDSNTIVNFYFENWLA